MTLPLIVEYKLFQSYSLDDIQNKVHWHFFATIKDLVSFTFSILLLHVQDFSWL